MPAGEGGVRDWVQVNEFASGDSEPERGVTFGITVSGERSGEAALRIDSETHVPVVRTQVVEFPTGEMRVRERYSSVELGMELADEVFLLPELGATIPDG